MRGVAVRRRWFASAVAALPEGKIFEVTADSEAALRDHVQSKAMPGTIIIDCYANWCPPCKKLAPMLEAAVKKTDNVRLAKLNVDENDRLPELLKVTAIPAVFAFYKGDMIATFVGCPSEKDVQTWVANVADPDELLENAAEKKS